jgi:nucleoside-diphosphate-sugar epimerase
MKRVLITGASGFIGRHTLALLAELGCEIHAVSSRSGGFQPPSGARCPRYNVHWHQANLLDRSTIAPLVEVIRPTHLLHLAWIVSPGTVYVSDDNFYWVQSSLDLVEAFTRCGGKRVVVSGSCYEYDQAYGVCSAARTPTTPSTNYGIAKNALRQLLEAYCRSHDLSFSWPRLFFMYGPGEDARRLVASVICSLLAEQPAKCSHGKQLRDFLYVGDVADSLVRLLDSDVRGPIDLGSGQPVMLRQIVETIGRQMDRSELVQLGALPARPGETPLIVADVTRQQEELRWTPQVDLETGIAETIAWWRERGVCLQTCPSGVGLQACATSAPKSNQRASRSETYSTK